MSEERRCGNCAWWDDRDEVEFMDGAWHHKLPNAEPMMYLGPGRCMREPVAVNKEPNDWCRHHDTTRGWEEDIAEPPKSEPEQESLAEKLMRDGPVVHLDNLERESARLKARCREATELFKQWPHLADTEWWPKVKQWLEGADDG